MRHGREEGHNPSKDDTTERISKGEQDAKEAVIIGAKETITSKGHPP